VLLFSIFGAILANRIDLWPRTIHCIHSAECLCKIVLIRRVFSSALPLCSKAVEGSQPIKVKEGMLSSSPSSNLLLKMDLQPRDLCLMTFLASLCTGYYDKGRGNPGGIFSSYASLFLRRKEVLSRGTLLQRQA
jgi:hypothetical protein